MKTWLAAVVLFAQTATPPAAVIGTFDDDYGEQHVISADVWQHGRAKYRITDWNPAGRFLVAQNDAANPSDPLRWTRIDWLELPAGAAGGYRWGFCLSTYNAPTREAAAKVEIAKRETPKTGCNGFPFTRMKPRTAK